MITIRKLSKLPPVSALRKSARLLQGFEQDLASNISLNPVYLKDLISFILSSPELNSEELKQINTIAQESETNKGELLRKYNGLRHLLLRHLKEEPADWDMFTTYNSIEDKPYIHNRRILPLEIYLDDIRSPFNVGSIFRTSESFGVSKILLSQGTAIPSHKRALRTSMGCTDIIPWEVGDADLRPLLGEKNIFALELNGEPMDQFKFPDEGICIIGSEELGVSPECLEMADNSFGRVSIPLGGIKGSINVSVAFGILMYNWYNNAVET
ncbi:MAG: TrmH family RNA methyltransferase [Spirochaetales bacterium]|nr:TrmH family RNA methyltransferase [Spirochaetales bacterium]